MNSITSSETRAVADLTLPFMPIENSKFSIDPTPYLENARREHSWLAKCEVGYVIHSYQAMKELMLMDDKLRTSNDSVTEIMDAKNTRWGQHIDRQILARSGPDHTRLRASVAEAFTPRNINKYRGLMREVISELLDEWAPKGRFDFADFASYFPITVICGLIGASPGSIGPIRKSLETLGVAFSLDRALLPSFEQAFGVIWDFVDQLVVQRESEGGGDTDEILNTLIASKNAGRIDDVELRDLLIFLFNAGYDSSKNVLTFTMYTMLSHPSYWERCAEDRAFCTKVLEEQFRHTSVASPYRTVAEGLVYRDVEFPKGTLLVFPFPLAGRDPSSFPDPLVFNPERVHANRHIAFGRGMHMCLGQHMARAQLEEAIHAIAQRITKPKLAGSVTWRSYPGVWGLRTLPIEFEPKPRRPEPALAS